MELIYGVCLKYLGTPDDAKDAVINIYEELITKLRKHQVEHFKAWLYQLSRNHCLMELRKKKINFSEIDDQSVHFAADDHLTTVQNREWQLESMEMCLETLSEEQKIPVTLFYLKGKCYKEIATSTGKDIGKVKSHIQNGRRNLKICMENSIKSSHQA